MEKLQNWWYTSNANKGTTLGYIFLVSGVIALIGAWIFIFTR